MRLTILAIIILLVQLIAVPTGAAEKEAAKDSKPKAGPAKTEKPVEAPPEKSDDDEIAEILDSMGYPELQVVPRASERLKMEAKTEASMWWAMHWPVQLSGLATLYAGTQSKGSRRDNLSAKEKEDANTISTLSTAVGAAWVLGGALLGAQRPYGTGAKAVSKITGKDERAELMRERLAEEALERPARTMRVLQHVSVASNFALNAMTIHYSGEKGIVVAGVATIMAFLPYMFEDPTISVFDKHIEYKKKIYAPLKTASFHFDPETREITPMTTLVWQF